MTDPQLVMALVKQPDGSVESEALFVEDNGESMSIELPDGSMLLVDDREFDEARRAA